MTEHLPVRRTADVRPRLVEHQLVRPDGTVLVSLISQSHERVEFWPPPGFEPTGPRAYRRRELPGGEWIVREFFDWPEELGAATDRKEIPMTETEWTCRGCTGTCCTGVGSDPCTCPPPDESAERMMAEVRAVLAAFDWERDDRQYALEKIERIVTSDETEQPPAQPEPT